MFLVGLIDPSKVSEFPPSPPPLLHDSPHLPSKGEGGGGLQNVFPPKVDFSRFFRVFFLFRALLHELLPTFDGAACAPFQMHATVGCRCSLPPLFCFSFIPFLSTLIYPNRGMNRASRLALAPGVDEGHFSSLLG